jgi:hypothetical protein
MWRHRTGSSVLCVLLCVACGQTKTSSESAPTTGTGGSSSADGAVDGHGGSSEVDSGTGGTAGTGGGATEPATSGGGGGSNAVATNSSGGGTTGAENASSSGNGGGSGGSGGEPGVTAEEAGCIATATLKDCPSDTQAVFACPTNQVIPETCSECYEPMVDAQGHPYNQCVATLPDGRSCQYCCCKPSQSGCEEQMGSSTGCVAYPSMRRFFLCISPYQQPSGCTFANNYGAVDSYCCP